MNSLSLAIFIISTYCMYRCGVCGKVCLFTVEAILGHVKYHNMTYRNYRDLHLIREQKMAVNEKIKESTISKENQLQEDIDAEDDESEPNPFKKCSMVCKICSKLVHSLEFHLSKHHRLSMQFYTSLFTHVVDLNNSDNMTAEDSIAECSSSGLDSSAPARHLGPKLENEDDGMIFTDNPNENCLFYCGICHIPVTCLRGHAKRRHGLSPKQYQASYPEVKYKRKTYHR